MSKFYGLHRKIAVKTAAYQVLPADIGTVFTNRGATAEVVFTLPNTATIEEGWWCEFYSEVLAYNIKVASYEGTNMVVFNNAAASSISFETSAEMSGATVIAIWDSTGWCCQAPTMETQTPVIA
jgi:hypothetical protein